MVGMDTITDKCLNKVSEYFHAGYTNQEICLMLRRDNIVISMRTLKRKLNTLGLRRRPQIIDDERVLYAIQSELEGSGCCLGYRSMTARLRNVHGLRVPRDYVRNILKLLEPERVAERTTRRFNRHTYINFGPNYLVHIDGYDKLKPFGFAIHGAMCGYSRRILWLKVAETNNDPYTVAYFFMEYVKTNGGVPRCIRADRGTENIFIEDLQKAMRWDHQDNMSADNSFIYGSSCRNQRIERWWLSLRQGGGNYWINLFKDMEIEGVISKDSALHIEILRFCFTEIIQRELDIIAAEWNQHAVRGSNGISGKPDILYFLPQAKGTTDYKTMVDTNDIEALTRMCRKPTPSGCASDFEELCDTLLQLNDRIKPSNVREAMDTFAWLLTKLG